MIKKINLYDLFVMFGYPAIVSLLTKVLNTWIFVILYGGFGVLFLCLNIWSKYRIEKLNATNKQREGEDMKDKKFISEFSDLEVNINESGWCSLTVDNVHGSTTIILGCYPNERWSILEQALDYVKAQSEGKNAKNK